MKSSHYFCQEQFSIEHFLVLKFTVTDALDTTISSNKLTFVSKLVRKMVYVGYFQQIAILCFTIGQIYLCSIIFESFECTAASFVRPIFGVSGFSAHFEGDCMIAVLIKLQCSFLLLEAIVNQSMYEATWSLSHTSDGHIFIFMLFQYTHTKDLP